MCIDINVPIRDQIMLQNMNRIQPSKDTVMLLDLMTLSSHTVIDIDFGKDTDFGILGYVHGDAPVNHRLNLLLFHFLQSDFDW